MHTSDVKSIFLSSVNSVNTQNLIKNTINVSECQDGNFLMVRNKSYKLQKPCYVIGFGKAVLGMATALELKLGIHLQEGVVTVPVGIFDRYKPMCNIKNKVSSKLHFIEGAADNLPDVSAVKGAEKIKNLVQKLNQDDIVIILISGGGSALLPLPKPPITLQEKLNLIKSLSRSGADIIELNCVRKKISDLKGGRLAEFVYPARAISLILSDVVGDPLDYIASGPTVPNTDASDAALNIVKKYSLWDELPDSIRKVLMIKGDTLTTIPIKDGNFDHVDNFIIGNNRVAAEAAKRKAEELGYSAAILSTKLSGDVGKISKIYAKLAGVLSSLISNPKDKGSLQVFVDSVKPNLNISACDVQSLMNMNFTNEKGVCIIGAGEPTVQVTGKGVGGRNQQLALDFSMQLNKADIKSSNITFLSCGTDGIDGPTDAAGAIGSSDLVQTALSENIDPQPFLLNNDVYNFYATFKKRDYLVMTGHTGTNVMDIHVLIVSRRCKSML